MLYLLLSAVASCVCFIFGQHLYIDSDEANYALAVQDMARGNFFKKIGYSLPITFGQLMSQACMPSVVYSVTSRLYHTLWRACGGEV